MSVIAACIRRDRRLAQTRGPAVALDLVAVMASSIVFFYLAEFVDHGEDYFPFVLAGITILRIHGAVPRVLQATTGRIGDGTLEILLTGRARPAAVMTGEAAFELLRGVALSVLLVAIGVGVLGADLPITVPGLLAVAVGLLGAAAVLLALTLALLALLMVLREAGVVSTLSGVLLPILAGVYFPRSILPTPLREITSVLPFHGPVDVIRTGLTAGTFPVGAAAVMVATSGAAVVLAAALVQPAVSHARRRGRLALE